VNRPASLGPILYGGLFVVALPVLLLLWAWKTEPFVPLPTPEWREGGWILVTIGAALMGAGMTALRVHGGGLPMNAYPPPVFVDRGVYRLLGHPIYVGFGLVAFGVSVAFGSASGLWLVTPLVCLGMAALVLGYEKPDLRRRFGEAAMGRPLLSLPMGGESPPSAWERVSVLVLVLVPWMLVYEAVCRLGVPAGAVEAYLPFERGWPVWVWTEPIYASVYPLVGLVPLLVRRGRDLRRFAVSGLIATGVVTLLYLTVPVVAPPRPFVSDSLAGRMLSLERSMSHTVAAFPSFHVIWTFLAAGAWAGSFPRFRFWVWTWAVAIAVSCITTGMHASADIAFAVAIWVPIRGYRRVWEMLRAGSERIANSWREWRWGPVRVLSYGVYAALAGGVGFWVVGSLVGPDEFGGVLIVMVGGLLGAGLWAQKLEGSSRLSRPFGYFGSLLGVAVLALLAGALGYGPYLLITAAAVAAPWIQALGRIRCLVQGCCHGAPARQEIGIRYRIPQSRVCALAGWGDVPLHPTPLYSMLANIVMGVALARLWAVGARLGMILGLYLIFAGLHRFVEEAYRGEPQTPVVGGLRLYQWLAVVLVVVGAITTSFPGGHAPDTGLVLSGPVLVASAVFALLCGFAMGVDFPGSDRKFARLAS
jgi:protein-S-isoprenylcysteine O-methyltransferase Ste14